MASEVPEALWLSVDIHLARNLGGYPPPPPPPSPYETLCCGNNNFSYNNYNTIIPTFHLMNVHEIS